MQIMNIHILYTISTILKDIGIYHEMVTSIPDLWRYINTMRLHKVVKGIMLKRVVEEEYGIINVYTTLSNGSIHGIYKIYKICRDKCQLWAHCYYKNDLKNGEYKEWHDNYQLCEHCYYKNDLR